MYKRQYDYNGPCYVRLGRSGVDDVYGEDAVFALGKGNVLKKGKKVALVACGMMVQEALRAAALLKAHDIDASVVDMYSIKPIDEELLIELANDHELFVTCEEHTVYGGLGSAVAEVLVKHAPRKVAMVGMQDTFGESGTPKALLEKYGLTAEAIVDTVLAHHKDVGK